MSAPSPAPRVPYVTIGVFRIAAALTVLAVVMGSVVCATESGFECGNWPGCTSDALLPGGAVNELLYRNPWIEMVHRASAVLAGPFALLAAVLALRLRGASRAVRVLPWLTVLGALVAGYVGRGIVLGVQFPAWVSAADLGSALVAMAAMVTAAVAVERTPAVWFRAPTGLWAWLATGVLLVMHLTSLYAAGPGSYTRCMSWPVWQLLDADRSGSVPLQWTRMVLAALAVVLVAAAVRAAWDHLDLRPAATAVAALLVVVLATGLVVRVTGSTDLGVPYSVATVGLLAGLVLLAARACWTTAPDPAIDATAELESADAR